jgi:hypothetical protein
MGGVGEEEFRQKGLAVENSHNFLSKPMILRDAIQFEAVPIWNFPVFVPRGTFPILGQLPKLFHVEQSRFHQPKVPV